MTGPRQPDTVASDAVDDLYRAHGVGLIRFALMLVGDQGTAEDVVQEAFLALYRGWHRVDDRGLALAYLRTAVLNGARSVHRSRRRGLARLLRTLHTWVTAEGYPPGLTIGGSQLLIWAIYQPSTFQVDLASGSVKPFWVFTPAGEFPEDVAW